MFENMTSATHKKFQWKIYIIYFISYIEKVRQVFPVHGKGSFLRELGENNDVLWFGLYKTRNHVLQKTCSWWFSCAMARSNGFILLLNAHKIFKKLFLLQPLNIRMLFYQFYLRISDDRYTHTYIHKHCNMVALTAYQYIFLLPVFVMCVCGWVTNISCFLVMDEHTTFHFIFQKNFFKLIIFLCM